MDCASRKPKDYWLRATLTVGNVEEIAVKGKDDGVVMRQSPAPGEEVEPGEKFIFR